MFFVYICLSVYRSIHPPIHAYIHTYTHKYFFFLGDVEQKQINHASWKREGRRTVIQRPELPRLSRLLCAHPARSRLFEDATNRSAGAQHPRRSVCAPPAPAAANQGAGGGMLGAGMQGCQATAASPCPVPPTPLLPPPGPGCALPALPAQLNSRGEPRSVRLASFPELLPQPRSRPCQER